MDYKLILCGDRFYQEIALKENTDQIKIGTARDCNIRFSKTRISVPFTITLVRIQENWEIQCSEEIYLKLPNVSKVQKAMPQPGERTMVCLAEGDKEVFGLDYYLDFPIQTKDYDFKISFKNIKEFSIGGMDGDVQIHNPVIKNDYIRLRTEAEGLLIDTTGTQAGFAINGIPAKGKEVMVKDQDFFSICGFQFFVYQGDLFTSSDGSVETKLPYVLIKYQKNHFQYPKFIKNARQQYCLPQENLEILDPDALPQKPEKNLLGILAPALLSLVMIILFRGVMGNGGSFIYYSVAMMAVGIITSVVTFLNSGKDYRKQVEHREKKYREYLREQEEKIVALREREYHIRSLQNPDTMQDIQRVADFDAKLFEKRRIHNDYLSIRLGKGIVHTMLPVNYKYHEYVDTEDYLMEYPKSISEKYELIQDMPVVLNLKKINAAGFIGNRTKLYQIAKNMILNLATEHFYQDVKFFFIIGEDDKEQFAWTRWFHNSYTDDVSIRNYMYDEESAKIVLEYLYSEFSKRDQENISEQASCPDLIIFVYRSEKLSNHPLIQFVPRARELKATFLFFEEYEEKMNENCNKRVFLDSDRNAGFIQDIENGENRQEFSYLHIPGDVAAQAALKLGCVYVDEVSLESSLTKNISFFQLLGIMSVHDLDLKERWNHSRIYDSMAAPLGVKSGGDIVYLDLHEKYHGPHGLVAGTTGSGKSEILQTYILSMATLFHPYEVGFIIIDFKGGGMVNQFRDLPHLNGAITNIDGREIDRSLLSIRAELTKRQELFAIQKVNHINDYIKAYKQGEAEVPLPHLILIVDEFAELKSEQPEFMKELISAARIGRSLGVHLILATQKPSGVVNDQIWSNSKFKLCLKVQNREDSNEVLKSPLAAEIREPGRAYLQVGNNEIFQLFQSAYSGASAKFDNLGIQKKYKISKVNLAGQREIIFEQKLQSEEDSETQLDAVVAFVQKYCIESKIGRLPNICLPPLPEIITDWNKKEQIQTTDIYVSIGVFDDPARQKQEVTGYNLTQSNLFILGASQMGKTNLLQLIIKNLSLTYSPNDINIYILDFGSMILRNFEQLSHVGGVITSRDDEKLKKFIRMIVQIMESRKELLSGLGLSSYSAYREAGYREIPQIVLMIDNVTAFKETFPQYEETFAAFCRDGISVGVSVVAANSQTGNMGLRFLSYFSNRISFTSNNSSDYSTMFERCRLSPRELPGRSLIQLDKEVFECQTFLAFEGEKEIERTTKVREHVQKQNTVYKLYKPAKVIPVIPKVVTEELLKNIADFSKKYVIPVGVDYENIEPVYLPLLKSNQIGMSGRQHFGKSNLLRYIIETLVSRNKTEPVEFYIVDQIERKLNAYKDLPVTVKYSINPMDVIEMVKEIGQKAEERYQMTFNGAENEIENLPLTVLLLNSPDAYLVLSNDKKSIETYKMLLGKYKNQKICIILSQIENSPIGFNSCEVIKQMKDTRTLFIFEDLTEQKVADVPAGVLREYKKPLRTGDAYMITNNAVEKVKIIKNPFERSKVLE